MNTLIKQILRFGIVGAVCFLADYGLMLLFTEAFHLMYGTVDGLGLNYKLAKIVVTAIVMIYNFISRKFLFEKR